MSFAEGFRCRHGYYRSVAKIKIQNVPKDESIQHCHPTSKSLTIPAHLSHLPVPQTLRPSTVPSVSLTIAGQYIVDDTDFVEVDLQDEIIQPTHSFLKALLSRVASFFRRIKSVFKKKDD